jgi:hypothetical protein
MLEPAFESAGDHNNLIALQTSMTEALEGGEL